MSTQADVPGYQLVERRVPPAIAAANPTLFIQILDQISGSAGLPAAPAAPTVPINLIRAAELQPDEQ